MFWPVVILLAILLFFLSIDLENEPEKIYGGTTDKTVIFVTFADFYPEQKRSQQLATFLEHMKDKGFDIVICEQIEPAKYFNRGQLFNAGIKWYVSKQGAPKNLILHDVDLLPDEDMLIEYRRSEQYPVSFSRFKNDAYGFKIPIGGGVLGIQYSDYMKCNGFPNNFWLWGGEDGAFSGRMKQNGIKMDYVEAGYLKNIDEQRENNKAKMDYLKKNNLRNMMTWELKKADNKSWKKNGIRQVKVDVLSESTENDIYRVKLKLSEAGLQDTLKHNESLKNEGNKGNEFEKSE